MKSAQQSREMLSRIPPPTGKKAKKTVDVGKLIALHNAGWSVAKIADELGVSTGAVYNYLPSKD